MASIMRGAICSALYSTHNDQALILVYELAMETLLREFTLGSLERTIHCCPVPLRVLRFYPFYCHHVHPVDYE